MLLVHAIILMYGVNDLVLVLLFNAAVLNLWFADPWETQKGVQGVRE